MAYEFSVSEILDIYDWAIQKEIEHSGEIGCRVLLDLQLLVASRVMEIKADKMGAGKTNEADLQTKQD